MSRVVVAGASGFMGQRIVSAMRADGDEVVTIGRGPDADAQWGDTAAILALIDGAVLVLNLAGRSVNCRYTPHNREVILRSRIDTTCAIGEAIAAAAEPPPLWLNSSTATIYRHAVDHEQTEADGELGTGFSVGIATAWEAEFFRHDLPATRRVALRTAIVLGDGSVLTPLARLARFGLGGAHLDGDWPSSARRRAAGTDHRFGIGGGRQRFSWVHIDDVIGIIRFLRDRPDLDGIVNVSSPSPSDDRGVMASIRRVLGVPFGVPMPRWMLEIGAAVIRTETELVLKSRWVVPKRLLDAGFRFEHPDLEPALRDILQR